MRDKSCEFIHVQKIIKKAGKNTKKTGGLIVSSHAYTACKKVAKNKKKLGPSRQLAARPAVLQKMTCTPEKMHMHGCIHMVATMWKKLRACRMACTADTCMN
jgi:hypothetical protein